MAGELHSCILVVDINGTTTGCNDTESCSPAHGVECELHQTASPSLLALTPTHGLLEGCPRCLACSVHRVRIQDVPEGFYGLVLSPQSGSQAAGVGNYSLAPVREEEATYATGGAVAQQKEEGTVQEDTYALAPDVLTGGEGVSRDGKLSSSDSGQATPRPPPSEYGLAPLTRPDSTYASAAPARPLFNAVDRPVDDETYGLVPPPQNPGTYGLAPVRQRDSTYAVAVMPPADAGGCPDDTYALAPPRKLEGLYSVVRKPPKRDVVDYSLAPIRRPDSTYAVAAGTTSWHVDGEDTYGLVPATDRRRRSKVTFSKATAADTSSGHYGLACRRRPRESTYALVDFATPGAGVPSSFDKPGAHDSTYCLGGRQATGRSSQGRSVAARPSSTYELCEPRRNSVGLGIGLRGSYSGEASDGEGSLHRIRRWSTV